MGGERDMNERDDNGSQVASGTYFCRMRTMDVDDVGPIMPTR